MLLSDGPNISMTTTDSLSGRGEEPVSSHPMYLISTYIWSYGSPVILLFGNFGNIMTIIIMLRTKSSEAVIDVYFIALACVDLVTLNVLLLFDWVGIAFGYYIHYQNNVICKFHNWTVGCTTTGGWILVCMTTHRAISVVFPHRVNTLCTRRLVTGLILAITAALVLVYSHYMYGYELQYYNETGVYSCQMIQGSYTMFIYEVFTYIDLFLYSLLPFTCIFVANSVLAWNLRATLRDVRQKFAESETITAREKAARSVTRTVIAVSGAYLVLSLPVAVYYISMFLSDPTAEISASVHAQNYLIRAVTFMLMFCNSAVNFYLYCLTGAKFRQEFLKIFCRRQT